MIMWCFEKFQRAACGSELPIDEQRVAKVQGLTLIHLNFEGFDQAVVECLFDFFINRR